MICDIVSAPRRQNVTCRCAAGTVHTLERYARPLRAAAPGGLLPTRFSDGMLTPVHNKLSYQVSGRPGFLHVSASGRQEKCSPSLQLLCMQHCGSCPISTLPVTLAIQYSMSDGDHWMPPAPTRLQ